MILYIFEQLRQFFGLMATNTPGNTVMHNHYCDVETECEHDCVHLLKKTKTNYYLKKHNTFNCIGFILKPKMQPVKV